MTLAASWMKWAALDAMLSLGNASISSETSSPSASVTAVTPSAVRCRGSACATSNRATSECEWFITASNRGGSPIASNSFGSARCCNRRCTSCSSPARTAKLRSVSSSMAGANAAPSAGAPDRPRASGRSEAAPRSSSVLQGPSGAGSLSVSQVKRESLLSVGASVDWPVSLPSGFPGARAQAESSERPGRPSSPRASSRCGRSAGRPAGSPLRGGASRFCCGTPPAGGATPRASAALPASALARLAEARRALGRSPPFSWQRHRLMRQCAGHNLA
mmetsp:Transcript_60009/g.178633  ORF Transcript_60009/g.178633 Transcript_60009/m.178633 type:complete len:276 (-) Transcript_60009:510-1337(-)